MGRVLQQPRSGLSAVIGIETMGPRGQLDKAISEVLA
jgi:hypothetical protein